MVFWDWLIVGAYVAGAIAIGAFFTKRAAKSTTDFFVAGRSLPWFIAGTSIVATTFSSDTPLFVAGMTRKSGISSNWFWWSAMIGQIASIFFFAKLWRRTEALTDVEFIVKRYQPGPSTTGLRIFRVFFSGIIVNCVVMASVTLAMAKVLKVMLQLSDDPVNWMHYLGLSIDVPPWLGFIAFVRPTTMLLILLGGAAVVYSTLSGLYGVVYTDLLQFGLAMVGSIGLAAIVYVDASGGAGLAARLAESSGASDGLMNFIPDLSSLDLPAVTFLLYISVTWWGSAPGGGYAVQRLLACRSERDSMLAFLWYNFCHYVLRSWPWLVVGLLSLITLPGLADSEEAFPKMVDRFLPVGLKGVMVASLLAAFMSTLDTHLNWGTSYLINDFYKPYAAPGRSMRHYVGASRVCMLVLTVAALITSTQLEGILAAYKYLGVIMAGVGTVMIARWYWWRVNPWSEISAMACSLVVGNCLVLWLLPDVKPAAGLPAENWFAVRAAANMIVTLAVWVTVTLLTSRKPTEQATAFYRKMRIPGPGWRAVAAATGIQPMRGELATSIVAWLSCTAMMTGLLLGIGKFLFLQPAHGAICLAVALAGGLVLKACMKRLRIFAPATQTGTETGTGSEA